MDELSLEETNVGIKLVEMNGDGQERRQIRRITIYLQQKYFQKSMLILFSLRVGNNALTDLGCTIKPG